MVKIKNDSMDTEQEYFLKKEKELLEKKRAELDKARAEQSTRHRKDTHWMKCPKCGADLQEVDCKGVMVDRCDECNGLWLDHGELELLTGADSRLAGLLKAAFRKK